MRGVLVTHADQPLGRRIVKRLWHDARVGRILAVGSGDPPPAFDAYRTGADPRLIYVRCDLARHRSVAELFRSKRAAGAGIDSVVYVPHHGTPAQSSKPVWAKVPPRTAEARLVLRQALELRRIRTLVALGSAFVYRPEPGNANHYDEESELDLDPSLPAEIRSWVDCDMLFHAEMGHARLRLVLLRLPTVVASGGYVYLHPLLAGRSGLRLRAAGFDPLCSVISDKDVAWAVLLALFSEARGIFNVAGEERLPLSQLARWTRRPCLPLPRAWIALAGRLAARLGEPRLPAALDPPRISYGMSLDTRRAERELGFRPRYRVALARAGDGRPRLEAVPGASAAG